MKYISLSSIGEFPEDLLFAKVDIEKKLLEDGKIEQRMKLEEFILYLDIQKTIYMKNQKSISFRYIEGKDEKYVFYSFLDSEDPELFESFKKKVENLKFDFSSLEKATNLELIQEGFLNNELFILNFSIYK